MLGNLSLINPETVFQNGKFKILYSNACDSFQVQYGGLSIPDTAAESIGHLGCLCEILAARLTAAGADTSAITRGLARFRISNFAQERNRKKSYGKTKVIKYVR